MSTKQTLTGRQMEYLRWLAADKRRYLISYGQQRRSVATLRDKGLIERGENFNEYRLTDAGQKAAA